MSNNSKVFFVNRSDLLDRLEPKFYKTKYISNLEKIYNGSYPVVSLDKITSLISDGTHFTPTYVNQGVKFISVKDVRKGIISLNNTKFITEEEANSLDKRCKPQKDDVLLTKIGATFGYASVVTTTERFQIFVSLALLRPKKDLIDPKYLEILLNSKLAYVQFERVIKGAGVPDLHLEDIRKIKVPLPKIDIQKKIVEVFKEQSNAINLKKNHLIKEIESINPFLVKNILEDYSYDGKNTLSSRSFIRYASDFYGQRWDSEGKQDKYNMLISAINNGKYPSVKLGKVLSFIESGSRPKGGVANINSGILSLGGEHVNTQMGITIKNKKFVDLDFHKKNLKTETRLNDLLIVKDGATTGKVAIINDILHVGQNVNEHVFLLRCSEVILPTYLLYFLWSNLGQLQIEQAITGATVTGITKDALKNISISLPPKVIQEEITEVIEGTLANAHTLKNEINKMEINVSSLMEKMIIGEAV